MSLDPVAQNYLGACAKIRPPQERFFEITFVTSDTPDCPYRLLKRKVSWQPLSSDLIEDVQTKHPTALQQTFKQSPGGFVFRGQRNQRS